MALVRKVQRVLEQAFSPPDKVDLRDENGIIGVVTARRFRRLDNMDRLSLIQDLLSPHLTREEQRRILVIVGVTPEEEKAHTATEG